METVMVVRMTSMVAAKKQDRADVAAFMKKTKRSMKKR
jgi:cytochrome c2